MGGIKKPDSSFGRLYEKALSRPEVRDLVEARKKMSRQKAIVAALRQEPVEPLPPLFTPEQISMLMIADAIDADLARSARQSEIASKPKKLKEFSPEDVYELLDKWADRMMWDEGKPDKKGWKTYVYRSLGLSEWRVVRDKLKACGVTEQDLIKRMRASQKSGA